MFVQRTVIGAKYLSSSTRRAVFNSKFGRGFYFSTEAGVNASSETANVEPPQDASTWCILSGFSPFVNRVDLQLTLGPYQPLKVDPLLDNHNFLNGQYALQYPNRDIIQKLHTRIGEKYPKNEGEKEKGLRLQMVPKEELHLLRRCSDLKITNSTVRTISYPSNNTDELYYLLEGFDIAKDGISRLPDKKRPNHYKKQQQQRFHRDLLIHFSNPSEAERAVLERGNILVFDQKVELYWYQA